MNDFCEACQGACDYPLSKACRTNTVLGGEMSLRDAAKQILKTAQYTGLYPESAFVSRDALDNLRVALGERHYD